MKRLIQAFMLFFVGLLAFPSLANAQGRPIQTLSMCEYRQPPVVVVGGVYIQQCRMPTQQETAAAIRGLQQLLKGRSLTEPYESPQYKKAADQAQKCLKALSPTPNTWNRNKFVFECDLAFKETVAYSEKYGGKAASEMVPVDLLRMLAYLSADPKYDEKSYNTVFAAFGAAAQSDLRPFLESASFLRYIRTTADWIPEEELSSKLSWSRVAFLAARKQADIQTACYYVNSYSSLMESGSNKLSESELNWQKENC
jgi:hypothetical protein